MSSGKMQRRNSKKDPRPLAPKTREQADIQAAEALRAEIESLTLERDRIRESLGQLMSFHAHQPKILPPMRWVYPEKLTRGVVHADLRAPVTALTTHVGMPEEFFITAPKAIKRWTLPWAKSVATRLLRDGGFRDAAAKRLSRAVTKGDLSLAFSPTEPLWSRKPKRQPPAGAEIIKLKRPTPPLSERMAALEPYDAWLRANAPTGKGNEDLRRALEVRAGRTPKISIVTPVYNTPPVLLRELVDSVLAQIYDNWELVLVDDASPKRETAAVMDELASLDARIKTRHLEKNGGISVATNAAADIATGEIIAFVDHDDLITPDCMAELAIYYADHGEADIVYSDDDKVDTAGRRFAPQFKPDYAPTLLLSFMYFGHIFSVRRSLFLELGGFDKSFDGSQDFDFALRAVEKARHVGHIPKVLYSWRVVPGSTAAGGDAKPESFENGRRAVANAIKRRGVEGTVTHPDWALKAACGIFSLDFPDEGPEVTLIIPTRNKLELLRPCVESLSKTSYKNYRIMVVDNDSDDAETLAYFKEIRRRPNIRVEKISNGGKPFSYARINNEAVRRADTEFVLLLNNDTEVIEPKWLSQMVGYARMDGVGAVGARLFFSDGTLQHAGIVHGYYNGLAGPAFRNMPGQEWGYLNSVRSSREYSAVTAACLLVAKDTYLGLGGLDETRFKVAYNDVDFCYRLVDSGLRCVYCADAVLYHHEGKTRGHRDNPRELAAFRSLYKMREDPWYNPNLSLESERFEIRGARPPRRSRRPVRAVMVSHNLEHEGAPNSMLEMVSGLMRRGYLDPIVVSPLDGPLRRHYEALGIRVEIVRNPIADVHTEIDYVANRRVFAEMLAEAGAEVVYGNTLQTFWAISAAKEVGIPALWNPRESEPWATYFDYLAPELRPFAYEAFQIAYAVVFVANATRENWMPVNTRSNFRVIHNGISLDRLTSRAGNWTREAARDKLAIAEDEVAVILVGTVCERKGQIDLVRAAALLKTDKKVRIFIVGDRAGEYSDKLHAEVASLKPAAAVDIAVIGETGDPYLYYRAADIAVCSSRIESYPRIILEAMACGLPIVTTPVFGIPEQVREGINAVFYRPSKADELAARLDFLIDDDATRQAFATASPYVLQGLTEYGEMLEAYARTFREAALFKVEV
jgi:glycosyltransferase involved in cell wall biosynthesis